MQVLYLFCTQNSESSDITHLSTTNHHKVINSQKPVRFFGPPCTCLRKNVNKFVGRRYVLYILLGLGIFHCKSNLTVCFLLYSYTCWLAFWHACH